MAGVRSAVGSMTRVDPGTEIRESLSGLTVSESMPRFPMVMSPLPLFTTSSKVTERSSAGLTDGASSGGGQGADVWGGVVGASGAGRAKDVDFPKLANPERCWVGQTRPKDPLNNKLPI